jgi:predicted Rossmann-fold nucleotide-binding protein
MDETSVAPEIAALGSTRLSEGEPCWAKAREFGQLLAAHSFTIVTGSYGGLMAVSRGAYERGGHVFGLPIGAWQDLQPNPWNTDLRWCSGYAARLNWILRCAATIALHGGVGTLAEVVAIWAARQTEKGIPLLVLLGRCWPPLVTAVRHHLVISDDVIELLHFADDPESAVSTIAKTLAAVHTSQRLNDQARRERR